MARNVRGDAPPPLPPPLAERGKGGSDWRCPRPTMTTEPARWPDGATLRTVEATPFCIGVGAAKTPPDRALRREFHDRQPRSRCASSSRLSHPVADTVPETVCHSGNPVADARSAPPCHTPKPVRAGAVPVPTTPHNSRAPHGTVTAPAHTGFRV